MALTRSAYKALVTLAGGDWTTYPVSTARLSSDPRAGLAAYLASVQNGFCALCGLKESTMELCHIVPGGPKRLGWTQGNITLGCRECNEIDSDSIIAFDSIKRPDLIVTQWPAIPILADLGRQEKDNREISRQTKRKIRGLI